MANDFTSNLVIIATRNLIRASWVDLGDIHDNIRETLDAISRSRILLERTGGPTERLLSPAPENGE
ncbi:hypothetical protein [Mesorhizobium sp. B1-1-8]|uniref:hypothetical protein n=1 Tax=Mesorhizobium sp. B1-1-8 TaxID=2589976 RepID=UPI001128C2AD|nr:hypothetical protein [Mesorhizobium sp. B1-1-8]UCI10711.1 hypothetical protein FJ974_28510 [Mesorhizobium sp. B1-1-8]